MIPKSLWFAIIWAAIGACGLAADSPHATGTEAQPDWPHLRGPEFNGVSRETGLVSEWSAQGPPVLWTRTLGQGYSGMIVVGDRVYTQYQTLTGQYLVSLDADTGKTVWETRYDRAYEPASLYPGPRGTPTYDQGKIYFTTPAGVVACLEAATGRQIWTAEVKKKFRGKGSDFGFAITPTVLDDLVILPVGGLGASLVALHCGDGSVAWSNGGEPASYTPVLPIRVRGERLLLALMENTLAAYEFPKGSLLWRIGLSQGYDEHSAWPVYSEPYVFISSPFRSGGGLYRLSEQKHDPPKLVRHTHLMSNDIFSCALVDGHLYGFDLKDVQAKAHRPSRGTFRCLEFPSLLEKWSTDRTGHANIIVADGKLILFNDEGELILAKQTPARYEELARATVLGGEICWTQPAA